MTQHEYLFVALSIILGLAITRLLHTVGMLIRAHREVSFHWSSALWAFCVMSYTLQFWWVGWGLREIDNWRFADFAVLVAGSIFVYGASEMALPVPESQQDLDLLRHSQNLGRLSALSMLLYFTIGPYVNITLFGGPVLPALILPSLGILLMIWIIAFPRSFKWVALIFTLYTAGILAITT